MWLAGGALDVDHGQDWQDDREKQTPVYPGEEGEQEARTRVFQKKTETTGELVMSDHKHGPP